MLNYLATLCIWWSCLEERATLSVIRQTRSPPWSQSSRVDTQKCDTCPTHHSWHLKCQEKGSCAMQLGQPEGCHSSKPKNYWWTPVVMEAIKLTMQAFSFGLFSWISRPVSEGLKKLKFCALRSKNSGLSWGNHGECLKDVNLNNRWSALLSVRRKSCWLWQGILFGGRRHTLNNFWTWLTEHDRELREALAKFLAEVINTHNKHCK